MSDERCPNPRCPHPRAMHSSRGCEAAIRAEGITYGRCACREKGSRDLTGVSVSDNPADSLRRELAEVIHRSGPMHFDRCTSRCSGPTAMEQEQAGCVLPFVEAARADERERIAKAIEAAPHYSHRERRFFAELARAVSDGD